jgi:hypothetical protein
MISTLSADTTIQADAPGGVWRAEAPPGTAAPYIAVMFQSGSSNDKTTFGGTRAYSDLCFEVFATGPAANGQTIASAAARIDQLLTVPQQTAITGGTLMASFRTRPIESDVLLDGTTWTNMGGEYRIMCKSS